MSISLHSYRNPNQTNPDGHKCSYNIEHILGVVRAAERKQSPLIIQLFPWAITFSDGLLVRTAADYASRASVPIAVHLDHCQDEKLLRIAAETLPFDSIMVDMSHHDHAENLAKTKHYAALCHSRGIAVEAEAGRLDGGEDGVADLQDLEAVLTTPDEVDEFAATGIDFLAPAFGNLHGEDGFTNARLDFERYGCSVTRLIQEELLTLCVGLRR